MHIVVFSDVYNLGVNAAAYEEAARKNPVAALLFYGVSLAREHTLVCLGNTGYYNRVGEHLLSYFDKHNVAKHDFLSLYRHKLSVTNDGCHGVGGYRELFHRSLCLDLLNYRNTRICRHNGKKRQIFIAAAEN